MFALVLPICSQIQQSRSHCSLQTWSNPIKKTSSQHYNKSGPALDFCFVLPRCLTRNISSHIHVTEAEEMLICPPVGNTWLNPRDTSPILLNIHPAACSPALTPRCNSRLLTDEKPPPPSFFFGKWSNAVQTATGATERTQHIGSLANFQFSPTPQFSRTFFCDSCVIVLDSVLKETSESSLELSLKLFTVRSLSAPEALQHLAPERESIPLLLHDVPLWDEDVWPSKRERCSLAQLNVRKRSSIFCS